MALKKRIYREAHPPLPPTATGAKCKTCGRTEPEVKFNPGKHKCRKCQYATEKARRGVWNKKTQATKVTAAYIRRLEYSHPERQAYMKGGQQGWAEYMKLVPAPAAPVTV